MSDLLSQDQLDAPLGQTDDALGGQSIGGDDDAGDSSAKNYDALTAALDFFNQKAGEVIGNVLNREVSMQVTQCAALQAELLQNSLPSPHLMVNVTFDGGLEGSLYLLLSTTSVAMLADLMLMGDGTAEYSEDHKDALGELVNQITGAYTTALGAKIGSSVSGGDIVVQEFDFAQPPFALQNGDMALTTLKVSERADVTIGMIVPDVLSAELMKHFSESSKSDGSSLMGDGRGVGLSGAELDDLSKVASDFSESSSGRSEFKQHVGSSLPGASDKSVDMLLDIDLDVSIELGRANLSIKRVLELSPGSVIELDRMAGEPVDLLVNNKVVAKGEVVVVDENFGIRIVSLVSPEDRIKSLR